MSWLLLYSSDSNTQDWYFLQISSGNVTSIVGWYSSWGACKYSSAWYPPFFSIISAVRDSFVVKQYRHTYIYINSSFVCVPVAPTGPLWVFVRPVGVAPGHHRSYQDRFGVHSHLTRSHLTRKPSKIVVKMLFDARYMLRRKPFLRVYIANLRRHGRLLIGEDLGDCWLGKTWETSDFGKHGRRRIWKNMGKVRFGRMEAHFASLHC